MAKQCCTSIGQEQWTGIVAVETWHDTSVRPRPSWTHSTCVNFVRRDRCPC